MISNGLSGEEVSFPAMRLLAEERRTLSAFTRQTKPLPYFRFSAIRASGSLMNCSYPFRIISFTDGP